MRCDARKESRTLNRGTSKGSESLLALPDYSSASALLVVVSMNNGILETGIPPSASGPSNLWPITLEAQFSHQVAAASRANSRNQPPFFTSRPLSPRSNHFSPSSSSRPLISSIRARAPPVRRNRSTPANRLCPPVSTPPVYIEPSRPFRTPLSKVPVAHVFIPTYLSTCIKGKREEK